MQNPQTFSVLYANHYGSVLRYAYRRVGADDAPDVAAEVFAVAWRRMDDIPPKELPWLYGVARKIVANHLRSSQRADRLVTRHAGEASRTPMVRDVGEQVAEANAVQRAWSRLSADDRELLALIGWERLGVGEAARVLGCSAAVCSVRLHRARRRLQSQLSQEEATDRGLRGEMKPEVRT
ncbi:RNA polymerase sigma-70 factor (ECF subfamily) [Streptomyces canus]|uniref:RNA polymerase sigma-70 factor (ECF subfamily) n=1 Tax=Streptomyces canus TaxID=58343 RepID=A0AAW8F484_9ACTN|nr:sigma-70 family RNA polymerase sigma factor [Streptomyces canus]MDQ0904629.1 RNA polymerase sigma-70 factor (ECF subfamily) [Streptomyces canus]